MTVKRAIDRKYQIITQRLNKIREIEKVIASDKKMTLSDFLDMLTQLLEENGITFVIAGGFARSIHAALRATSDIDIVIATQDKNKLEALLKNNNFKLKDILDYTKPTRRIIKYEYNDGYEVDILDFAKFPSFTSFLLKTSINRHPHSFLGIDGLIITKLCSFRYKDNADLIDLLHSTESNINMDIIKEWCAALGIMDRFSFLSQTHENED